MPDRDFKPSDVTVSVPFPFVDTFRHAESECMAAMMVLALVEAGDTWVPIKISRIGVWMKKAFDHDSHWKQYLSNPFMRPHTDKLIAEKFCRWTSSEDAPAIDMAIEFTEAGMAALRKWVI